MRAIRKSDGKQIEVTRAFGGYYESDGELYSKADLDFLTEKETAVLEVFVARDEDGFISLYQNKPTRDEYDCRKFWHDDNSESHIELPTDSFPSVTWQSEPKKVKIKIEEI